MTAIDDLFSALAGIPSLPDARCVETPQLFDEVDDFSVVEAAKAVCHGCPALDACRDWADTQPRGHLSGVVAGRVHRERSRRAA